MQLDLELVAVATGQTPDLDLGPELLALVDALTTKPDTEPEVERAALVAVAGEAIAERAIGVCATFQMMNRLLDGVGAPVNQRLHPIAEILGFDPAELPR